MSKLKQAVGANTAMSPVQPMRSSRWGQSVGISMKLERAPHWMLDCSWLSILSEHSKLPICRTSDQRASASTVKSAWSTPVTLM